MTGMQLFIYHWCRDDGIDNLADWWFKMSDELKEHWNDSAARRSL